MFRVISGYSEMLSGLVHEYDNRHLDRIQNELGRYGGEYEEIRLRCYTLNWLLGTYGIANIDYLSIDIEGAELSVLESIDFERFHFSIIGVENNYQDYRIPKLLTSHGFVFHSIVGDEFYINRKLLS